MPDPAPHPMLLDASYRQVALVRRLRALDTAQLTPPADWAD